MTGYPISLIIDKGIDLHQFDCADWDYDPHFEVVFVRPGTKLFTFLALALNNI
jgi:hypothetical protein